MGAEWAFGERSEVGRWTLDVDSGGQHYSVGTQQALNQKVDGLGLGVWFLPWIGSHPLQALPAVVDLSQSFPVS